MEDRIAEFKKATSILKSMEGVSDDTWEAMGIVFETVNAFLEADAQTIAELRKKVKYYQDISDRDGATIVRMEAEVANQSLDFGALTKASAGGDTPTNTGATITSASIDSGDASTHWQISATGEITPTGE